MEFVSGILVVPLAPLLAAAVDWLEAVLPLIFVLVWIVSQIANVVGKVRGGAKKPVAVPPPPRPVVNPADPLPRGGVQPRVVKPPRPARPAGVGLDEQLRQQIEQFLRERPPESIELEQVSPPTTPARKPTPVVQKPRRTPTPPKPPVVTARRREVGESTMKEMPHLASSLKPAIADEPRSQPTAASVAIAGTIAGLLADPRSLRQAIVLREVLDRPVERWS